MLASFVNLLGFNIGTLPFIYLGVPIVKGKPIADRIQVKLAPWKATLLTMVGRV